MDTELSGLVFVLDGGILATTLPERPAPTASPGSGQASIQNGSVTASVTVLPTRTVVVDDTERIVEIWSNTGAEDGPYYALRVKQNQINGDEHPLTPSIWNQYICLLDLIDWQITDKVYP
ncbi:MAG: hypothetical protein HY676_05045 [Chloroflexi bacterium]|nr:hypothetical protein [Chloroflexota bacterium]